MISSSLLSTGRNNETSCKAGFLNWFHHFCRLPKWVESRTFWYRGKKKFPFDSWAKFLFLHFLFSFIGSSYLLLPICGFYTCMPSPSYRHWKICNPDNRYVEYYNLSRNHFFCFIFLFPTKFIILTFFFYSWNCTAFQDLHGLLSLAIIFTPIFTLSTRKVTFVCSISSSAFAKIIYFLN